MARRKPSGTNPGGIPTSLPINPNQRFANPNTNKAARLHALLPGRAALTKRAKRSAR